MAVKVVLSVLVSVSLATTDKAGGPTRLPVFVSAGYRLTVLESVDEPLLLPVIELPLSLELDESVSFCEMLVTWLLFDSKLVSVLWPLPCTLRL